MKKASIILSALAVTAAVSTAMAHTKSSATAYCLAREEDPDNPPSLIKIEYNGSPAVPCGTVITCLGRLLQPPNPFTYYGYLKTTPAGQPCQVQTTCPAIRFVKTEE